MKRKKGKTPPILAVNHMRKQKKKNTHVENEVDFFKALLEFKVSINLVSIPDISNILAFKTESAETIAVALIRLSRQTGVTFLGVFFR